MQSESWGEQTQKPSEFALFFSFFFSLFLFSCVWSSLEETFYVERAQKFVCVVSTTLNSLSIFSKNILLPELILRDKSWKLFLNFCSNQPTNKLCVWQENERERERKRKVSIRWLDTRKGKKSSELNFGQTWNSSLSVLLLLLLVKARQVDKFALNKVRTKLD